MIHRSLTYTLHQCLSQFPGVVLIGPAAGWENDPGTRHRRRTPRLHRDRSRASGRSRPARAGDRLPAPSPRATGRAGRSTEPAGFFSELRSEIDAARNPGRFLLLGSASGRLLGQASESLAGRVAYLELTPLRADELQLDHAGLQSLWLRGGFPLSYTASDDAASFVWRENFIATFLQRDLPQLGVKVAAEALHRFWRMLAQARHSILRATPLALRRLQQCRVAGLRVRRRRMTPPAASFTRPK